MRAYMFAGQGSQQKGMGRALFAQFPAMVRRADEVLGYSIEELCVEDPKGVLAQTQYTQPALYVVNALAWEAMCREGAPPADYFIGHSLGEYNALLAASAFDFASGLKLVKRRGELMAQAKDGGMAAVVGLDEQQVAKVLADAQLSTLDIANFNTPSQIVVAGPNADIVRAAQAFEKAGARYLPLRVSAAFHSRYMQQARDAFAEYLSGFRFAPCRVPVIANVNAKAHVQEHTSEWLADQLRCSVQFSTSIRMLWGLGVKEFKEVGHSAVLTGMVRQIQAQAQPLTAPAPTPAVLPTVRAATPFNQAVVTQVAKPAAPASKPAVVQAPPPVVHLPVAPHGRTEARDETHLAESLGSAEFRAAYGVRLAYASGSMYRGIASEALVVRMARAGLLSFYGTAGLQPERVAQAIDLIQRAVPGRTFGMNLLSTSHEDELVDLYLKHNVDVIEASAYLQMTRALVKYRLRGLSRAPDGSVRVRHRIMAKVSRPEVAEAFLSPAPERIVRPLLEAGLVTAEQVELARRVPMADDLTVEADSGGHTDQGVAAVLLPSILRLRDKSCRKHGWTAQQVRIGAAGGIGTPEAALSAFVMGADYVVTGSINQCSVEAGHSDAVKDLLMRIDVQDTAYAPAGDMFEIGARVQVLKKGVFFPARANKLYDLYKVYPSLDAIDARTREQIEQSYFGRSFEQVFEEVRRYKAAEDIARAERDPRYKMALVFKWYFAHSNRLAFEGNLERRADFQIHCGPAMGAFNQWVADTALSDWRKRHVDDMAERVMRGAAELLAERLASLNHPRRGHTPVARGATAAGALSP